MRTRVGSVGVVGVVALAAAFGCELDDPPEEAAGKAGAAGSSAGKGGGAGGRTGGTGGTNGGKSTGGTESNGASAGETSGGGTGQAGRGGSANASGGDAGAQENGGDAGDAGDGGSTTAGTSGSEGGEAGASGPTPCTPGQTEDRDDDDWTLADGDCDDCEARRHPGNFDVPSNEIDDDCDGNVDNSPVCDEGLASNTTDARDFARALDLCKTVQVEERGWGVVNARLSLADGTGVAAAAGHAVRSRFGTNLVPLQGESLAVLSTGAAAGLTDTNPSYAWTQSYDQMTTSGPPSDFAGANGGSLAQSSCPPLPLTLANDSQMLELRLRVPANANSFSLRASFYSYDFPEWVCSPYIDLWVMLLGSEATPARADRNLAVVSTNGRPVGVNLATGNTGLFKQCVNGETGCESAATEGTISTCSGTSQLDGTGFGDAAAGVCSETSRAGGATGWLSVGGNVQPGELVTLRVGLWDVGDHTSDSTLVLDAFEWSTQPVTPGATP
jgi:hypothetical protein